MLTSLRSTHQCRLVPKVGDHHRVPGVLLLPRVHCLGAFENAQALALHRFHAKRSLGKKEMKTKTPLWWPGQHVFQHIGASERLARGTVWTKSWKSQYVAFHCRGAAFTGEHESYLRIAKVSKLNTSCFLTGYDLLSRLCRRAPRICAHRPLWASKFCASLTS